MCVDKDAARGGSALQKYRGLNLSPRQYLTIHLRTRLEVRMTHISPSLIHLTRERLYGWLEKICNLNGTAGRAMSCQAMIGGYLLYWKFFSRVASRLFENPPSKKAQTVLLLFRVLLVTSLTK